MVVQSQKAVTIKMQLPSLEQLYRRARSIYYGAFEKEDFVLRLMRWSQEEAKWGYPHKLSIEGLRGINTFAENELAAMIIQGKSSLNTSLPLTETQRARERG